MRRSPLYVFKSYTSRGIFDVPLNSIVQVLETQDGRVLVLEFISKEGLTQSSTIQDLLNNPNLYNVLSDGSTGGELTLYQENGLTGYKLAGVDLTLYGPLGQNSIDFSFQYGTQDNEGGATGDYSFAGNVLTYAQGKNSVAFNNSTKATGENSFAIGRKTLSGAKNSFASGQETQALAKNSEASGYLTRATGLQAHAEGNQTLASGQSSHAEGLQTEASGYNSHAEGFDTISYGFNSHAEGRETQALGYDSHAEGLSTTAEGEGSHAEGRNTKTEGDYSHAEGTNTVAGAPFAHAEGDTTIAGGAASHAEGIYTLSSHNAGHAEGKGSQSLNYASHAEGVYTTASGYASHSEGFHTVANGDYAHSTGEEAIASGKAAFAGGYKTLAASDYSFAFGKNAKANNENSIAFGVNTSADAYGSLTSGYNTQTTGIFSVALGRNSKSIGSYSFTAGYNILAPNDFQTALGKYNIGIINSIFEVGVGDSDTNRKNAINILTDGKIETPELNNFNIDDLSDISLLTKSQINSLLSDVTGTFTVHFIQITEDGKTGYRLYEENPDNHGSIGDNAIDLSFSNNQSDVYGATGNYSFAIGLENEANGNYSFAGGYRTKALNDYSWGFGYATESSNFYTFSFGIQNVSSGLGSFAFGKENSSEGNYAVTFGSNNIASGKMSHAEGYQTEASGEYSVAFGIASMASGYGSYALGFNTFSSGNVAIATGSRTEATGQNSFAGGYSTKANASNSFAFGRENDASGANSAAFGRKTKTISENSFAVGYLNTGTSLNNIFEIGSGYIDINGDEIRQNAIEVNTDGEIYAPLLDLSKIENADNKILITREYIDNYLNTNTGSLIRIEENNKEGYRLKQHDSTFYGDIGLEAVDLSYSDEELPYGATGDYSFAAGYKTSASELGAVALNFSTQAQNRYTFAANFCSDAVGEASSAFGTHTIAGRDNSVAMGHFNAENANAYFVIGNGAADDSRSNIFEILDSGEVYAYGSTNAVIDAADGTVLVTRDWIYARTINDLSDVDTTTTAPTNGQTLKWDGTNWVPGDDNDTTYTAGTGIDITNEVISLNAGIDLLTDVDTTTVAPTANDILSWDGTNWSPRSSLAVYDFSASDGQTTFVINNAGPKNVLVYSDGVKVRNTEYTVTLDSTTNDLTIEFNEGRSENEWISIELY